MRIFIAGDSEFTNEKLREAALHQGYECAAADMSNLDEAAERSSKARQDLIVVVLSSAPAKAVQVVRDIRDTTHVPILAVGPTDDSTLILRVLREGADEYVGETEIASQASKALIRLKSRQRPEEADGATIAIVSPCGGTGTSTLAASLAAILAKRHKRSALFDLRLGVADLRVLLDLQPNHTLAELCRNASRMDDNMLEQAMVQHSTGVHLLSAPVEDSRIAEVTPGGIRKALYLARSRFPFVALDMDRNYAVGQATGLVQSDQVLVVLRLDMTSLAGAARLMDRLSDLGINEQRVRVVASRHGQAKELSASKIENALGVDIANFIPEDAARVNRCNNRGTPVVVEYPRARISKAITALATDIERSVNSMQPEVERSAQESATGWASTVAAS